MQSCIYKYIDICVQAYIQANIHVYTHAYIILTRQPNGGVGGKRDRGLALPSVQHRGTN